MIKFLHVSDIHIGSKFINKSDNVRKKLRKALNESIKKIVQFSIDNDLDFLIIAGDLFDDGSIPFNSENIILSEFEKLRKLGIKIFYSTGNHDPGSKLEIYERFREMENVFVFLDSNIKKINFISKSGEKVTIVSSGYDRVDFDKNLVKDYPVKTGDSIYIGIAHAMVTQIRGAVDNESYMPCSLSDLLSKKYDYFALGHIHKRMALDKEERIWYSGNPQGLNYKETGSKGGNFVKIDGNVIDVKFAKFGDINWESIEIKLDSAIFTRRDLIKKIEEEIENSIGSRDFQNTILRIFLTGRTPLYSDLMEKAEIEEVKEELIDKNKFLYIDFKFYKLFPLINIDEILVGDHVLSSILSSIDDENVLKEIIKEFETIEFLSDKYKKGNLINFIKEEKEEIINQMINY